MSLVRAVSALVLLGLLALLAAPPGAAQTVAQPMCAPPPGATPQEYCTYDRAYLVFGRVLDANGNPAKGAQVRVSLVQDGVVDAAGNPPTELGSANCKGDFEFAFFGLRSPSAAAGRARATIAPPEGNDPVTAEAALDPFYRRNDLVVHLPYEWPFSCVQQPDPDWSTQISAKGRIVNRTAPYEAGGATFHAKSYQGPVGLYYHDLAGVPHCPPDGNGGCAPIPTDEFGNFKYTWTFTEDIRPGGKVEVVLPWGASYNATVDVSARLALHRIELSGQGAPSAAQAPGPGLLLVAGALVAAARLSRSLLPAKPR